MKFKHSSVNPLKASPAVRSCLCVGWVTFTAVGWLAATVTAAHSASVPPFDEPLCYMRLPDGSIVDLQSLCHRSSPQPSLAAPSALPNAAPPREPIVQSSPTQPQRASALSGSHAQGNPDSDDGRY